MDIIRFGVTTILLCACAAPTAAQVPFPPLEPPEPPPPVFFELQRVPPVPPVAPVAPVAPVPPAPPSAPAAADREQAVYEQARSLIEQNRYEPALGRLDSVIAMRGSRTDAAMYWKAYSLSKLARRADALTTLNELFKNYSSSRWIKDARALDVELRQASGQPVSAAAQDDDELKLLALRGLMQSDPASALPIIEKMLAGTSSPRVKDRALFVVSQDSSARARELLLNIAKGGANPDLQRRAIRYLGMRGGDASQVLDEVYRSSSDPAVKREVLRSFMVAGARDRLLALAKSETSPELRGEAVQQLGVMGAANELDELYRTESSPAVKRRIVQAMFVGGHVDKLTALAKSETDPELRRVAIRNLGLTGGPGSAETLKALYASEQAPEVKRSIIEALFLQNNGTALIELARAEKNPELKRRIVEKLSVMDQSSEVKAYMLELLK